MTITAEPETIEETITEEETPHSIVVWNDEVNTMEYVVMVFIQHFSLSFEKAEEKMLEVHNEGRSVLDSGSKDAMEFHAIAMNAYGLRATVEKA